MFSNINKNCKARGVLNAIWCGGFDPGKLKKKNSHKHIFFLKKKDMRETSGKTQIKPAVWELVMCITVNFLAFRFAP